MSSTLVDLEKRLIDWAWNHYENITSWFWRKKRENVVIDVNWTRVKQRVDEPVYANEISIKHPHMLFQTRYDNASGGVQNNRFSTEKETTSTVSVKLMKGFTRSVDAGISLPLPKDGKPKGRRSLQGGDHADNQPHVSAVFGNNVQICCDETTVVEKKQKWTVDTTVTSRDGFVTEAQQVIEEIHTTNTFQMNVQLKGTVVVNIRDKMNIGKLIDTIQADIVTRITDMKRGLRRNMADVRSEYSSDWATWPFKGEMEIKYGICQSVKTVAIPIAGAKNEDRQHYEASTEQPYFTTKQKRR